MTDNKWTAESIRPFILDIIQIFGVDRCMFASNFPVEKVVGSYQDWYTAFKQIVASFTQEQQKKLFYDNAIKFYRL
jgi:predicted TIM-barrel fold metal-dependent hydrolase